MHDHAFVLILAGGGGTRLWPASRKKRPKQFLPLVPDGHGGVTSLLAATVERLLPTVPIERLMVVTSASQVDDVRAAVPALPARNIVVEPEARNTAPCIGLGTLEVLRRDPEAIVAVVPSDQHVANTAVYRHTIESALRAAAEGQVVTIGIHPTRPETGFGYIHMSSEVAGPESTPVVERFVEKPDRATAEGYVRGGAHLWNSGMFFFQARRMMDAFAAHMPDLAAVLERIRATPSEVATEYGKAPKISIDYGVMERLPRGQVLVVPAADFGWNDVGSWSALAELETLDGAANAIIGDAVAIEASRNIVWASGKQLIALVGVNDLIVAVTDDAVLVIPRERAQDVRLVVEALQKTRPAQL